MMTRVFALLFALLMLPCLKSGKWQHRKVNCISLIFLPIGACLASGWNKTLSRIQN
jgi:hypothetical protein